MQNNELEQENSHIKFWENCLNDLKNTIPNNNKLYRFCKQI